VCELDEWHGLAMDDIRRIEEEARRLLNERLDEYKLPTREKRHLKK
jgi:hypothetical protein